MPLTFRTNTSNEDFAVSVFSRAGWKVDSRSYSTDQTTVKIRMVMPKPVVRQCRCDCGAVVEPYQMRCERCERYAEPRDTQNGLEI